jgi:hypothetical protein
MIIKESCRDFRIIEKSSRDSLLFSSNLVRGMQLKHICMENFYGGKFFNFRIFFWTGDSPELAKCGMSKSLRER